MKYLSLVFLYITLASNILTAQNSSTIDKSNFSFTPEFNIGHSFTNFSEFPDRKVQTNFMLNFGWENDDKDWHALLKKTTTGFSLSYTNFGNNESLGSAYSLMPFIKFNILKKDRLSMLLSLGTSYFTEKHDREKNFGNQAISTDFLWSFRSFFYYKLAKENPYSWQIGIGFFHHSNGHTRLPNQGLNSALISFSKPLINSKKNDLNAIDGEKKISETFKYFSFRSGLGINTLSIPKPFNDKELVNTVSIGFGKIFNKNYKIGIGAYYNFYKHYYNYISNNESMVQIGREFEYLKSNPTWNASAIGISINGELLLNHIGIETRVGFNIHKPAYKIDKRINQDWYFFPRSFVIEDGFPLGELDTEYKLKRFISTRIGLKYYLFSMNNPPKHNIVFGVHINSNLGQADFTEFSIGYLYTFRT